MTETSTTATGMRPGDHRFGSVGRAHPGVEIRIADDGKGFDPAGVPSGRYGLSLIRERGEAIGALLSIQSRPGRGTELVIQWPNPSHAEVP